MLRLNASRHDDDDDDDDDIITWLIWITKICLSVLCLGGMDILEGSFPFKSLRDTILR